MNCIDTIVNAHVGPALSPSCSSRARGFFFLFFIFLHKVCRFCRLKKNTRARKGGGFVYDLYRERSLVAAATCIRAF